MKTLTIRNNILFAILTLAFMMGLVVFQGIQALNTLKKQLNTVTKVEAEKVMLSQMMRVHLIGMHRAEDNIINASTGQQIGHYQDTFAAYARKFELHLRKLRVLIQSKNKAKLNTIQDNYEAYIKNVKGIISLSRVNTLREAKVAIQEDMTNVLKELDKISALIITITEEKLSTALEQKNGDNDTQTIKTHITILTNMTTLEKNILQSLRALQNLLLTQEAKQRDALKQRSKDFLKNTLDTMEHLLPLFEHTHSGLALNLRSVVNKYTRLQKAVLELSDINFSPQALNQSIQQNITLIDKTESHLKDITAVTNESMKKALIDVDVLYNYKKNQLISLSIIAILLGLSTIFFLFKNIAERIKAMIDFAEEIGRGRYPEAFSDARNDELSPLSQSLNLLNDRFKYTFWTKTGQSELSTTMRGETDLKQLTQKIINYLAPYLHAQVGAFYLSNQLNDHHENSPKNSSESFSLLSCYAYQPHKSHKTTFTLGEGFVGQAALEKKSILFSHMDKTPFELPIASGFGKILPSHIFVLPLIFNHQVLAVLELGSTQKFNTVECDYLHQVAEGIAISLNMAINQSQTKQLLQQTQKQAQILKKQEEDVREKNVALQYTKADLEEKARQLTLTSKYKSEFLANMSHELRTPLNSLLLFAHSLAENKANHLNKDEVESALAIHDSGIDLLDLINEILDLAKIEAGKIEITPGKTSLNSIAENIQTNFQHQAEQKGLDFSITQTQELPEWINTDPQRLKQILNNLLSNALKFTPQGKITVSISRPQAEQLPANSQLVAEHSLAFAVRDTGIGIANKKQQLIFEAFQQIDRGSTRQYGGTGLGLSISKELAHLLGGMISLQSKVAADIASNDNSNDSSGSTFTLYLPEHWQQKDDKTAQKHHKSVQKNYQLPQSTAIAFTKDVHEESYFEDDRYQLASDDKTVLIIEDDIKFVKFVANLAHAKGFKVLLAKDGEMGLALAHEYQPKAIILDIGLPRLDGWTVMDELKSAIKTRHIPVYFISIEEEKWNAMYMGAIGFLTKPVNQNGLEQVFHKINTVIAKTFKHLLLALAPNELEQKIIKLMQNHTIEIVITNSAKETLEVLKHQTFDCMVLDLNLSDMFGFDLLNKIVEDNSILLPPVLVYTGKPLSSKEAVGLQNYPAQIVKGIQSEDHLVAEITLFLHRTEAQLSQQQKAILKPLYNDATLFKDKTILLVDDNARNMIALSHILKAKGLTVKKAFDGQEALNALNTYPDIDLVLMDMIMPNMNGYEAMQKIRKQEKFKHLPIIALTAKAIQASKESCLTAGANDYLTKPVNPLKLFSRLRFWLAKQ